ncbi:MAG: ATP-dependent Clp protease adaptor ClpS [Armatimonadetes bacterium]|nr:ATP-dependent Clp protease adaptor ClpS [Armatimonadota bacterium]
MATRTQSLPRPELLDEPTTDQPGEHLVIVWDNDHNTWEEVIDILQKATNCSLEEAITETWEVHHLGKSVVHHAAHPECQRVARIIRTIGIKVTVEPV